jgi:hypothetical protein
MVAPLGKERGFIDEQLIQLGQQRQVRLSVPNFSQLEAHLLYGEHIVIYFGIGGLAITIGGCER